MAASARSGPVRDAAGKELTRCSLRLFVAGDEPNSVLAKASLDEICSAYPQHDCEIEIVDVLKDFRPALAENILVTPTLIVNKGGTRTVIFGNLSDTGRVLAALQLGSEKL
jgi:circadian clock protein KaiB